MLFADLTVECKAYLKLIEVVEMLLAGRDRCNLLTGNELRMITIYPPKLLQEVEWLNPQNGMEQYPNNDMMIH